LPAGPGRTCEYLGDLGGLSRSRKLIMPDTQGTGESADASDPLSYRCDRLAGDVEALRAHLGLWTAWICWDTPPRATWPRCTRLPSRSVWRT